MNFSCQRKVEHWVGGHPFIQGVDVQCLDNTKAKIVRCQFSLAHFENKLFNKLGITLPLQIKHSVHKRRAEFLAGRLVAKLAFFELGQLTLTSNFNLKISNLRAPLWPEGIHGSITHTHNTSKCLLVPVKSRAFVGIDVENIMDTSLASDVGMLIQSNSELNMLLTAGLSRVVATTLLFSAKESLFKAVFPFVEKYLDFKDSQLKHIDLLSCRLTLSLDEKIVTLYQIPETYRLEFFIDAYSITTMILYIDNQ